MSADITEIWPIKEKLDFLARLDATYPYDEQVQSFLRKIGAK